MRLPDYILENEQWALRWDNWNNFLEEEKKIRYKKQNKTAIVCLFYSSLDNIKLLSEYISKEKYHDDFDFIIINNSHIKGTNFEKEIYNNNNIIILSPIVNLWTDWWYALWLEYVIKNNYDYVFIVEDDVILLDKQTFSDVYNAMNKKTIWFIYPRINDEYIHSRHVQFTCYPIGFLKKCGIIDPRFFTRGWDWERVIRIEEYIKTYWYKKIIINKRHLHPYLKKNNRNTWRIYFAWRNTLWSIKKSRKILLKTFWTLFMYIRQGFSKLFFEKSDSIIIALFYAIKDFIFARRKLGLSLERMNILSKIKIPIPSTIEEIYIPTDKLSDYTKDLYISNGFSPYDLKNIQWSKKIKNFFNKWIIIPNINSPLYPILILSKKTIIINEFNFKENKANIYIFKNHYRIIEIKSIISLLLSIITFLIVFLLILGKLIYYIINWLICSKK